MSTTYVHACLIFLVLGSIVSSPDAQERAQRTTWPVGIPLPMQTPKADTIDQALRTRPIVLATVEAYEGETSARGRIVSRQRIEHVYSGPDELVGETFLDISAGPEFAGGRTGTFFLVTPTLEVGETGIWILIQRRDGIWQREFGRSFGMLQPARKGISPTHASPYEHVLEFALTIGTVWNAESERDRIQLLKEYAQSSTAVVAAGAIRLLAEVVPDEFQRHVGVINLSSLPLLAQVTIDEAMMQHDRDGWRSSDQRRRMMSSWSMRAINNEADVRMMLTRLSSSIQRIEIEPRELYDFLQPIIKGDLRMMMIGKPYSREVRSSALALIRHVVNEPNVRDDAVGLMLNLLDDDHEVLLHETTVRALQQVHEFAETERVRLQNAYDRYRKQAEEPESLRHSLDMRVASILEELVHRHRTDD